MLQSPNCRVSLPRQLMEEVEQVAKEEQCTKRAIILKAVRYYLDRRSWRILQQRFAGRAQDINIKTDDDIETLVDEIRR